MTSDRCPTCDELAHELDLLRADIAEHLPAYDIATQGDEPEHANPREVVEYAGDELRRASKDAERWRKVAPLIEALADVSINDGDDPQELEALRNAILAATKEP